jgi:hypothetical protein
MGTWVFGGKNSEDNKAADHSDEEDDRRIRFTIGGAGRRLTKDDFLKEIQSLDPKARCEIVEESDAPAVMKAMAKKDASNDSPGTSRLFEARNTQAAAGKGEAKALAAEMARRRGGREVYDQDSSTSEERIGEKRGKSAPVEGAMGKAMGTTVNTNAGSGNEPESAAERKRREKALRGVDDVTDAQRGRSPTREEEPVQHQETAANRRRRLAMEAGAASSLRGGNSGGNGGGSRRMLSPGIEGESAAERRRREAALGVGTEGQEDSDDDDTPRVPPPVARSRGIRFAQSPVRGKK